MLIEKNEIRSGGTSCTIGKKHGYIYSQTMKNCGGYFYELVFDYKTPKGNPKKKILGSTRRHSLDELNILLDKLIVKLKIEK
jgi:hypothetical protein